MKQEVHIKNMGIAYRVADFSKSKRKQVGAIIIDKNSRIVGTGFNGTPSGVNNCCEIDNKTLPYVIHAELNAIVNSKISDLSECTLYVTYSPCISCAAIIIQKKIKTVIFHEEYHDLSGVDLLRDNNIYVYKINPLRMEISNLITAIKTINQDELPLLTQAKINNIIRNSTNWDMISKDAQEEILDTCFTNKKFDLIKTINYINKKS